MSVDVRGFFQPDLMMDPNQLKVILLAKEALVSGDGFSDCSAKSKKLLQFESTVIIRIPDAEY